MVKGVFYRLILEACAEFLGVSAREILEIILDFNHVAVHIAGGLEKAVDAHGARGIVDVGEIACYVVAEYKLHAGCLCVIP